MFIYRHTRDRCDAVFFFPFASFLRRKPQTVTVYFIIFPFICQETLFFTENFSVLHNFASYPPQFFHISVKISPKNELFENIFEQKETARVLQKNTRAKKSNYFASLGRISL